MGVAIGVAMDRALDRARNDLGVAVTPIGVPDQRRDHQRPAHHQTEHRYSPSSACVNCRVLRRSIAAHPLRACKAQPGPLASTRKRHDPRPRARRPPPKPWRNHERLHAPHPCAGLHDRVPCRARRRGREDRLHRSAVGRRRQRPAFWRRKRISSTSTRSTRPAASTARSSSSSRTTTRSIRRNR